MIESLQPIVHVNKRVHTSFPGAQYILPADELEKERLNRQHYGLKHWIFENKIVFPPVSFQPGDSVLDSGTGTGVWLQDLVTTCPPTMSLYGIDIESLNFPPPSSYPSNIHFQTASILSLPTDWTSKFTLINQRLVFAQAIAVADIPVVLSEYYRVLKPGGWVQFLEFGNWSAGPLTEKHKSLILKFTSARGLNLEGYRTLPQKLFDAGFEDIQTIPRTIPHGKWAGEVGEWARDNLISVWKGMKNSILNGGGFGVVSSEAEFDSLIEGIEQEWDKTPGSAADYVVFYARKSV